MGDLAKPGNPAPEAHQSHLTLNEIEGTCLHPGSRIAHLQMVASILLLRLTSWKLAATDTKRTLMKDLGREG